MALDEESGVVVAQCGSYKSSYVDTRILNPFETGETNSNPGSGVMDE